MGLSSGRRSRQPRRAIFIESAAQAGLTLTHVSGASGHVLIAEQMGAVSRSSTTTRTVDVDVVLVQGGPFEPGGKIGATHPTSRLFRNDLRPRPTGVARCGSPT